MVAASDERAGQYYESHRRAVDDLRKSESDHSATHEDLREAMQHLAERETLCQDLRNQMVAQGMMLEEERSRILKLEGYIDRVREVDMITHAGMMPAVDHHGSV
jgi:hypothetical protein